MSKIKVIINEDKYIPGLGRGPFTKPVLIDSNHYFNLKQQGYLVIRVKEPVDRINLDPTHLPKNTIDENNLDQDLQSDPPSVQPVDNNAQMLDVEEYDEDVQDATEDDSVIQELEGVESTEEKESEKFHNDMEELTVKDLKELLDDYGVSYKQTARKDELIKKLEQHKED